MAKRIFQAVNFTATAQADTAALTNATYMALKGGSGAPDNLEEGAETQAWLAASNDPAAQVSGRYFYHQKLRKANAAANDPDVQEKMMAECARLSGISFPEK